MAKLSDNLYTGAYKFGGKVKHEAVELSEEIKKTHKNIKEKRREITGGHIEDKTKDVLKAAEENLEKLINKIKN